MSNQIYLQQHYIKMSFGNNSRNIANLLRYDPLEPIKPSRNVNQIASNQNIQRDRQEIPINEVFTPQQQNNQRKSRRVAPLSSAGNNRNDDLLRLTNPRQRPDFQIESFKVRLDQVVKYYDERHSNLQSKIMVRLNELQNFVMKQVPKIDNTIMVGSDIAGFKQALKQVRRQQQYQLHQLNSLKGMVSEKNNNQMLMSQNSKQKQKQTVLFMELVRLGDTVDKFSDQMSYSSKNYENKIQELQQKLINSQKNLSIISQRTSSGSDVLSEFGDKMMNRLQSAESNLLILGKQQIKDKDTMNRIVQQNQRMGDDLQVLLRNMQSDFQNKLENRITDTINKLVSQHEDRIRAQEDIKKNLDLKERITQQKQLSQKMENKARYDNMDALVRTEFLKKDQSIRALHSAMEQQFHNIMRQIQGQGLKRKDQQLLFRSQIKKVQQSFRKQYDLYKNHQGDLVQKITDMIKAQIQVRLNSQLDLKKITTQIANQIVTELNNVKQAIASTNKKFNLNLKQISNESSQRAGQLSHYIDQQVKKVVDVVTQKYSKMKNVFTKLAQQFKNHLLNTQTNRKNHQNRLTAVQEDFQKLKSQVNAQIDEFYNDLESRLKQQKEFVQTVVFKKNNDLTLRVNKLQEYTNQYFQVLKSGIQDNKQLLNNKIKASSGNKGGSQQSQDEVKQLRTIIFNIKSLTEQIKQEHATSYRKLQTDIDSLEQKTKETMLEMGNNLNGKITRSNQKINQIQTNLSDITVKVNSLRAESGSQNAISTDRLKKISDQLQLLTDKFKDMQQKQHASSGKSEQQLIKLRSDVTVLKSQVGALDDDIKKLHQANNGQ